jgi:hypothetical protein
MITAESVSASPREKWQPRIQDLRQQQHAYQGEPTIEESHTNGINKRENALYGESQEPPLGFGEENEAWESYNQS